MPYPFVRSRGLAAGVLLGLLVATAGQLAAQPAAPKKVLTFADYDIWRSASGVLLSPDGKHLAYLVGADGADGEAIVREVATGKEYRFPRGGGTGLVALGTAPRFTPNGKQVLLPLTPTKAELDQAKADKLKAEEYPKAALAIIDLGTGKEVERVAGVGSFQVGGSDFGFLIYRKPTAPEPARGDTKQPAPPTTKGKGRGASAPPGGAAPRTKTYGSDLYIRDLASGTTRTILDVSEFSLSQDEKALVYTVSSKNEEKNGVYVLNPKFGTGG
ncbi:MAG TPA: hypothetical protein VGE74_30605, partial [Gemmata sp.]